MAEYARVENGQVVEIRSLDVIPPHKASLWTSVQREGTGDVVDTVVESNVVRIVRSEFPLDQIKLELKARIDADAERVRLGYITAGAGMALTYQEKFAQAQAVEALGEEAANALAEQERVAQFPTLSASVGIEADTLWGCAQLVISRYETFAALSGVIERIRLAGKKSISDASDAAGARAAYGAVTWTIP